MRTLYPEIEPHTRAMLDVGDGQHLYYEVCGAEDGKPAVVLHGGPGSGCTPGLRRFFDPDAYRVVLFDQRQCGRSTPHAGDVGVELSTNTTPHLLADLELLRRSLGVDRWLVFGGSWGSALGLAYAEDHPDRVSAMVLTGVATGRRSETRLLTRGLGRLFPDAWEKLCAGVPAGERGGDLSEAYGRLLAHPDLAVRERAARDWCDWEVAIEVAAPEPNPRYRDARFRMAFARIVTHYWSHGSWLDEGTIFIRAPRLAEIPGVIVQGTLDFGNLLGTPWDLCHAWPTAQLVLVDDAGHAPHHPGVISALVEATDRFAPKR
jgi:proline iminopeptidase